MILKLAGILLTYNVARSYEYPDYCTKIRNDSLADTRGIPLLSLEAKALRASLIQVTALVRHGARTPIGGSQCWEGYQPHWFCSLTEIMQPTENGRADDSEYISVAKNPQSDMAMSSRRMLGGSELSGMRFVKRYDANYNANVFQGSCQKGQLLSEGYKQHQFNGKYFYEAYLEPGGAHRIPDSKAPPLVEPREFMDDVYVRSTDMQRTFFSAMAIISQLARSSKVASATSTTTPNITVHTVDLENEYLYPNLATCPAITQIKRDFSVSAEYDRLVEKYRPIKQKLLAATGLKDLKNLWPGGIYDCLMTTICTGQWSALPEGLVPAATFLSRTDNDRDDAKSLLNLTFDAIDDLAAEEFVFQNNAYARASAVKLMVELKANAVQSWQRHVGQSLLEIVEKDNQTIAEFTQYIKDLEHEGNSLRGNHKLILYSAHDTSIMMLVAALGEEIFDRRWPPYASAILFEEYKVMDTKTNQWMPYFRLIYNGVNLTPKIPGCISRDICPLQEFFEYTSWATPSKAVSLCQEST